MLITPDVIGGLVVISPVVMPSVVTDPVLIPCVVLTYRLLDKINIQKKTWPVVIAPVLIIPLVKAFVVIGLVVNPGIPPSFLF